MATGPLLQLAKYISEKGLQEEPAVQHAVWAVTDQHPLENIYQSDLAGFAAELLGKSAPEYAIVHQLPQEAGAPAFRPAPARLEGYFRYNLPEEQIVSFGLYDAEGKVVHHFFTNRKQLRGYHKFRFTFEIRNVPSGDYTVRLVSGNKTIEKMEVKF